MTKTERAERLETALKEAGFTTDRIGNYDAGRWGDWFSIVRGPRRGSSRPTPRA